jgi:Fe2+ or Zn2+ uptake regulation protein
MKKGALSEDLPSHVEVLHAAGLRTTGPRLAILHLLRHDTSHPTAEQVYRRLRLTHPRLSLATVYNTLEAFTRRGLCRRVPPVDGRQRFDGTVEAHHHALCTGCGSIFDVPVEVYQPPPPPPHLGAGLPVRGVQVTFEVLCPACQQGVKNRGAEDGHRIAQPTHKKEV